MLVSDVLSREYGGEYRKGILFGVEIEVENGHDAPEVGGWRLEHDGSLRNEGREYVFHGGRDYEGSLKRIINYAEAVEDSELEHNYRTSVHIHVNVVDLNLDQLAGLILTYYVIEQGLFDMERWESPYCIPLNEAPLMMQYMLDAINTKRLSRMSGGDFKYMALGTCRLPDLGTLEFRMFNGTNDADELVRRLDYVNELVNTCAHVFEGGVSIGAVRDAATHMMRAFQLGCAERASLMLDHVHLILAALKEPKAEPKSASDVQLRRRGAMAIPQAVRMPDLGAEAPQGAAARHDRLMRELFNEQD